MTFLITNLDKVQHFTLPRRDLNLKIGTDELKFVEKIIIICYNDYVQVIFIISSSKAYYKYALEKEKDMKNLLSILLSVLCLFVGVCFAGCNKEDNESQESQEKYQVAKVEYESAFTVEALQNVTISMTGPYWERDHIKSYFYSVGKNFALCSYSEDTQYYGRHYGFANGEEFAYVYGNERLEDFTEEQAVWTKVDNPSYYKTKGVNFVFHYRRDFHLLEYNSKTKSYDYEIAASGEKGTYSYFFTDKKLTKFVITNEADDYKYVWDFYDYGTTKIPEEIDKSTPEEPSLPLTCIISPIPYKQGEEIYQKYFTTNKYCVADTYEEFVFLHKEVLTDDEGNYIADLPYEEKEFENFVILCYYRCVSGSLNFLPIEYAYIYSTNEIVRKKTYQPPENTSYPAVVVAYSIDFVKVPRSIFEQLNKE